MTDAQLEEEKKHSSLIQLCFYDCKE